MKAALCAISLAACWLSSTSIRAAITYIDAVSNTNGADGNTTINGDFVMSGVNTGGNSGTDNLWRDRGLTGSNGDTIWETDTARSVAETTVPLITTVALPGAGNYRLYALYVSQVNDGPTGNTSWDLEAGVSMDGSPPALTTFVDGDQNSIYTTEDGSEFTSAVFTRYSSSELWLANLGTFNLTAEQAAAVSFYINGPDRDTSQAPSNANHDINYGQRTWYEGVAYELVPTSTPGDFDADGDVDGADFVVWQTNNPTVGGATLATGDANGDGNVDGADFAAWQTNFPTAPSSIAAVPEPSAMAILLSCLAVASVGQLRTWWWTRNVRAWQMRPDCAR